MLSMTINPPSTTSADGPGNDSSGEATRAIPGARARSDSIIVSEPLYTRIGRYRILSQLGKGGFGLVFRAFDPELNCEVAIKIPRADRVLRPADLERFRNEARTLARIRNHPSIVTVYDVGQTEDGIVYAVMEFVEGEPLSSFIETHHLSLAESLEILVRIAGALGAAHRESIVHRDLKPSNVILDRSRNITLVDFGLALHDDLSLSDLGGAIEGTPKYMSPEQIRGENHRIDGQTDIWAFGVMMYRMLTGKHPFRGRDSQDLARSIRYRDAQPLRQLKPEIPREIERICLKCLSKNMCDRYLSVPDLMEDLTPAIAGLHAPRPSPMVSTSQQLLRSFPDPEYAAEGNDSKGSGASGGSGPSTPTGSTGNPLKITHKGLRPFDSNDRDFFLQLLPGPRNREGIPESIQFWRSRLLGDELEPLEIGLIYGPSGCGKSSFVRAGLLPVLPARLIPVYFECTGEDTERRLAQQIAHRIHSVDSTEPLSGILRQIRRGEHLDADDRLVLVLDQFEQWLYGKGDFESEDLTAALRQCDGRRVTCLLLIRDDFWMSTSEFMKRLEIPIREGANALALPLFDERHARQVLIACGRSFDRLPDSADPQGTALAPQQKKFIRDAVKSLAQNGRVICVHLSVFAQIVRDREWTASELHRLGGLKGVGIRFLEDLFPSQSSSRFRTDQDEIVKSVFRQLLPGRLTVIKGTSVTREKLWQGLDGKYPRTMFDEVLLRLESGLRLISRVDTDEFDETPRPGKPSPQDSFRLTHDFLVLPIREWLDRKQKETWRGRAAIRLEELGERWAETRSNRFLPTPIEYAQALIGVDRRSLDENTREVLHRSHRHYGLWLAVGLSVLGLAFGGYSWAMNRSARNTAQALYATLLEASPAAFLPYAERIGQYRSTIAGLVENPGNSGTSDQTAFRRALVAVLCQLDGDAHLDAVVSRLEGIDEGDVVNARRVFAGAAIRSRFMEKCRSQFASSASNEERARIAAVLASLGDTGILAQAVAADENQSDRTLLICNLEKYCGDPTLPLRILLSHENADVLSAMLATIAIQHPESYREEPEVLQERIRNLYRQHPRGAVHSGAEAVAKRRYPGNPERVSPPDGADWLPVPELACSLIRIPVGELVPEAGVPPKTTGKAKPGPDADKPLPVAPFWISDREVTGRQFHAFLVDPDYTGPRPDPGEFPELEVNDNPARGIGIEDGRMFCNWASLKAGRDPVYAWTDGVCSRNVHASGFRIPTWPELEHACRCGGKTALHLGDPELEPLMEEFEVKSLIGLVAPRFEPQNVASKLPNSWGLFDTLGGAAELCVQPEDETRVFCRGFHYSCYAAEKDGFDASIRDLRRPDVGLRIAAD